MLNSVHGAGPKSGRAGAIANCCAMIIRSCGKWRVTANRPGAMANAKCICRCRSTVHRFLFVEGSCHQCRRHVSRQGQCVWQPNWLHMRSVTTARFTVVVSGTKAPPRGQLKPPTCGIAILPCNVTSTRKWASVIGQPSPMGEMLSEQQAEDMIFGFVLLNGLERRDIQQWEYVPGAVPARHSRPRSAVERHPRGAGAVSPACRCRIDTAALPAAGATNKLRS